ncbi:MAG: hypothetical protein H6704_28325 [Myxococcales bacterium]|nr:hypothetical protein [Myxococcales bacterium]
MVGRPEPTGGDREPPASPERIAERLVTVLAERIGQPVAFFARFGILGGDGPMVLVGSSPCSDAQLDALDDLELDPTPALSNQSGEGWWGVAVDLGPRAGQGVLVVAGERNGITRRRLGDDATTAGELLTTALAQDAQAHERLLQRTGRRRAAQLARLRTGAPCFGSAPPQPGSPLG